VASAEKLLLEAEFAFRNISPGSTDERKFTARAKRYASKLVRKYPASSEAEQAHTILRHLGVGYSSVKSRLSTRRPASRSPHADHTRESPHRHQLKTPKPSARGSLVVADSRNRSRKKQNMSDDSWENIWRIFLGLSHTNKRILAFLLMFVFVIIGFTPFLLVFFLYYVTQPARIRSHVHTIVTYFA
jgi:hypothetical protein